MGRSRPADCSRFIAAAATSPRTSLLEEMFYVLCKLLGVLIWLGAVVVLLSANNAVTAIKAGFVAAMALYAVARRSGP